MFDKKGPNTIAQYAGQLCTRHFMIIGKTRYEVLERMQIQPLLSGWLPNISHRYILYNRTWLSRLVKGME